MPNNPNAVKNLRKLKPGETANPKGRPRKLVNLISDNPRDEQLKIYAQLLNVIKCGSIEEARKLAQDQRSEDYGLIIQLAIDSLVSPNGWNALNDIMDRLFGKAKITTENTITPQGSPGLIIRFGDEETK